MKTNLQIAHLILALTAGAVLVLNSGCGKSEQSPGDAPNAAPPSASGMQKGAEPAPAATQTDGTAAAPAAPSAMSSQVDGLLYNAKGLATTQKYQDALNVVQQLSALKLTPEQQKQVDALKTVIQAGLAKQAATGAATSVDDALSGKK